MKHYNIRISGKVQGVFFRANARKKAEELGIKGFVQNAQDGSVYIEAEAPKNVIDLFVSWCYKGPDRAVVNSVEVNEMPLKNFTGFEVRHI